MTKFPFALRADLLPKLPAPSTDGRHYLDVRVAGKWDGVLVVDSVGMCLGVYVRRRTEDYSLPFSANEIEDIRQASIANRLLASIPFELYDAAALTIVAVSPIALVLCYLISPLLALFSVVSCALAIYVMYLYPGFPFTRLLLAMLGFAQIAPGIALLVRFLFH